MLDWVLPSLGLLVGFMVGLTGVGGGALMTPALIWLGVPPVTAVGTDLIVAAITKCVGVAVYQVRLEILWRIVFRLSCGSVPGAALAFWILETQRSRGQSFDGLITTVLSVALILTALITLVRPWIAAYAKTRSIRKEEGDVIGRCLTPLAGFAIGVMVTLSSVGAGALGAAALLLLYPRLPVATIVGIDLAHALIIASIAGVGHIGMGSVDYGLLGMLLIGSIPGVYLGSVCASKTSDRALRPMMAAVLILIGGSFAWSRLI